MYHYYIAVGLVSEAGIAERVLEIAQWNLFGLPIGVYGLVAVTYILSKVAISLVYRPYEHDLPSDEFQPTASVVIPEYNENPNLFQRGIESVLAQDYPLEEIWIVDDGSANTAAWAIAKEYAQEHAHVHAHRFDDNRGKREAQAYAFEHAAEVDVFVTMDSDTIVDEGSVEQLLHPFAAGDVTAVTGYPRVVNRDTNILTRLIDMRYWVAFNVERAAQSVLGVTVCCCGVLSAYRYDIVMENLDEYTTQEFLGAECSFGDDRRMTAYALKEGRVLYQSTATSLTDAPTSVRQYLTQQTRWMRSFWRESFLALRWSPRRSVPLTTMLVIDLLLPFALVTIGFGAVVIRSAFIDPRIPLLYVFVIFGIAYLRNMSYSKQNLRVFALSPLYAVFYLCILLPLSFYALATVNSTGWGTR